MSCILKWVWHSSRPETFIIPHHTVANWTALWMAHQVWVLLISWKRVRYGIVHGSVAHTLLHSSHYTIYINLTLVISNYRNAIFNRWSTKLCRCICFSSSHLRTVHFFHRDWIQHFLLHFDQLIAPTSGLWSNWRNIANSWDHAVQLAFILLVSSKIESVHLLLYSRHIPIITLLELFALVLPIQRFFIKLPLSLCLLSLQILVLI